MGINPWQTLKLDKDISWQEIEEKLSAENNVDSAKYKSIFEKIAGADGILSQEEWNSFTQMSDVNKDGNLTFKEVLNTCTKKFKLACKNFKNEIINFYNMIKDIVNSRTNKTKTQQKKEQYIENPLPNNKRAKSRTKGNFTDNWLAVDKYGSKTYEDWINNLKKDGYEFDRDTADRMLKNIRSKCIRKYYGQCSKAVTDTVTKIRTQQLITNDETGEEEYNDVELFDNNDRQESAYQNASVYANNPNFKEIPQNIVSTMDLSSLPRGCIIVYDAAYIENVSKRTGNRNVHPSGHIGITDGQGNDVSWGTFEIPQINKDTKIRVFIPVKQIKK